MIHITFLLAGTLVGILFTRVIQLHGIHIYFPFMALALLMLLTVICHLKHHDHERIP
jgi:hypothetical protein